jgi:hypothetical protein
LQTIGDFFGAPQPEPFGMLYYRSGGIGGQEGLTGCQVFIRKRFDVTDLESKRVRGFYEVATHEIFHRWNPIWLFPLDDPWIKEGMSSWYGRVLAARLGVANDADFDHVFDRYAKLLESNPILTTVALSDPRLWDHEYDGENWRTLTYERGMAVTLLLDVLIRERSQNAHSLDGRPARPRATPRTHFLHAPRLAAGDRICRRWRCAPVLRHLRRWPCLPVPEDVKAALGKARQFRRLQRHTRKRKRSGHSGARLNGTRARRRNARARRRGAQARRRGARARRPGARARSAQRRARPDGARVSQLTDPAA